MPRSVEEWVGKTDDTPVPPRVRLRVFEAMKGRCGICGRKVQAGDKWTCEHVKALINGGENREDNLGVTCSWCLPGKNADDVAEKSTTYRKRSKHAGIKKKSSRPLPGSKDSPWKQTLGNGWMRR
ncbi:HNH endonuclease signature motif containing protein [Ferrovibrio terrae]|uniref:HNH endonuclease n=1 Tax=Ferrovibrio terrae TaxID=2594003 RepID=UPI0031380829